MRCRVLLVCAGVWPRLRRSRPSGPWRRPPEPAHVRRQRQMYALVQAARAHVRLVLVQVQVRVRMRMQIPMRK